MIQYSKNFTDADFPIGKPHSTFLDKLQSARDAFQKPMIITRGGSTPEHNAEVGGVQDSSHLLDANGYFRAVDILCIDSIDRYLLLKALMPRFARIGIYARHIHVDDDPTKPIWVMWVGEEKT